DQGLYFICFQNTLMLKQVGDSAVSGHKSRISALPGTCSVSGPSFWKKLPSKIFVPRYFFIFGLNTSAPIYPKTRAAAIPAELAVRPPLNIPKNPSVPIPSFTPFHNVFPKPSKGTAAPAPAQSRNG